jgi:hypothetical protein
MELRRNRLSRSRNWIPEIACSAAPELVGGPALVHKYRQVAYAANFGTKSGRDGRVMRDNLALVANRDRKLVSPRLDDKDKRPVTCGDAENAVKSHQSKKPRLPTLMELQTYPKRSIIGSPVVMGRVKPSLPKRISSGTFSAW